MHTHTHAHSLTHTHSLTHSLSLTLFSLSVCGMKMKALGLSISTYSTFTLHHLQRQSKVLVKQEKEEAQMFMFVSTGSVWSGRVTPAPHSSHGLCYFPGFPFSLSWLFPKPNTVRKYCVCLSGLTDRTHL